MNTQPTQFYEATLAGLSLIQQIREAHWNHCTLAGRELLNRVSYHLNHEGIMSLPETEPVNTGGNGGVYYVPSLPLAIAK